jgi:hypothetical protein
MSDDLFQPAPRDRAIENAVVGGEWSSRHPYVHGYYLAARELVKPAIGNEPQDALFYINSRKLCNWRSARFSI